MKKVFNIFNLPVLFLVGFLTISCDPDKDNPVPNTSGGTPGTTNTEYNGAKYNIKNGYFQNSGAVNYYYDDEAEVKTHSGIVMALTDGTPIIKDGDLETMPDGKMLIISTLLSPGTSGFKTGTFEISEDWFDDMLELDEAQYDAKYKNKYFAPLTFVYLDKDNDKNWEEETPEAVSEGTFKVSGTSPNFTTEYDLKFANGKTLKGSFSGKFSEITDLD